MKRIEETGIELTQLLDEVLIVCKYFNISNYLFISYLQEKLSSAPLLIMANKQDLMNALTVAEVIIYITSYNMCLSTR